jgi:hypothetical protein
MTVPGYQAPAPEGLTSNEPFVSGHTRALVTIGLFVAYIAVALFSAVADVLAFFTNPVVIAAEEGVNERLTLFELLQGLAGLATLAVFVALAVAFLMWLHRASKNLRALGNPSQRIEYTPGWAVGWFFIPFANLVMPYKAVREVWEKSDPAVRTEDDYMFARPSSTPLLPGWWVTFIASNVAGNISGRLMADARTDAALRFTAGVDLIASLLAVVAAVLAILVVRGIDRRQAERARHVMYVPHMPPPPPIFTQHTPPANADAQQQGAPPPASQG